MSSRIGTEVSSRNYTVLCAQIDTFVSRYVGYPVYLAMTLVGDVLLRHTHKINYDIIFAQSLCKFDVG